MHFQNEFPTPTLCPFYSDHPDLSSHFPSVKVLKRGTQQTPELVVVTGNDDKIGNGSYPCLSR